jgi:hypothetical protein
MATALRHRVPLVLINNLIDAGGEPLALTVNEAVWLRASTHQILRPLPSTDGRVTLAAIREEMERHRLGQWEVLSALVALRNHFLLCFGMGLAARFDLYATRWSHDIDLLVDSLHVGQRIANILTEHGFSVVEHRIVDTETEIADWKLERTDEYGGLLHVDLSCGAVSNSTSWLPPLILPDVFDRRIEVTYANVSLCVPSDLDQMILIAHKAQRNLTFDIRTTNDIAVLLSHGNISEDKLWVQAERHRITGAMAWLAGEPWRAPDLERALISISARLPPNQHGARLACKWLYSRIWHP